jgi:hypothetical protein
MAIDAYVESSSSSEPSEPSSVPFTGDVQAEITRLTSLPGYRDGKAFDHGQIIDQLADLYQRLGGPDAQDQADQPQEDTEPLEVRPMGDAVDDALDQLERDWGENLAENVRIAQSAVADLSRSLGGDVAAFLDQSGLSNSPVVIKVFHALGSGSPEPHLTKAEAQSLLTRLQSTPEYLRSGPLHSALVDVVADLTAQIHG